MSITKEQWYGGSQTVGVNTALSLAGPRLTRATHNAPVITLPALTNHLLDAQAYGLRFIVAHDGSLGSLLVKDAGGTTLASAAAGRLVYVYLYDSGGTPAWTTITRRDGTARTAVDSARSTIVEVEAPPTYDPADLFCFMGNDCEYAAAEPLDGQDGRELVCVPMFLNPCELAENSYREAIRGADVIMPSAVVVRFPENCFTEDSLHPLAGGLSPEFYEAFYNNGNPHRLPHDAGEKLTGSTSRNPYHLRISTLGAWTYNAVSCVKHVWHKQITYEVGLNTYTLTIRFQAEHTVADEPALTGYTTDVATDQGGKHTATAGAWGTLFSLGVFTDELSNGFVDGNSYTPAGAATPVAFSIHDPFVWGQAPGVSEGTDDKFCHPQLVAFAMLPTTLHDPCGYQWIPPLERETVPGTSIPGYNLGWAYRRPNCLPWVSDPDRDLANICTGCGGSDAIIRNTMFSNDNLSNPLAAMSTGGGLPTSRPTERLLWENGAGVGRTYLVPGTPSWDEEIGELAEDTASCGSISLCIDWDGSWSEYAFETCDGHPAEMFNDVGGTHYCFKNNATGDTVQCCIAIESARAEWEQVCIREWVDHGGRDPDLEVCIIIDDGCYTRGRYTTEVEMAVYDYYLATSSSPITPRRIEWRGYGVTPDSTLWSYTYDQADVADITQPVGAWTLGATITTTPAGSETLTAMLAYDPPRNLGTDGDWRDAVCSVQFRNCTNITHGLGFRMEDDAGDDAFGYGAFIEPTGVGTGNAKIAVYTNGAETVLASKAIVLDDDVVDAVLTVHGHGLTFAWEVTGQLPDSLTVNHCTYTEGGTPTLFTKGTAVQAEFADWTIQDKSYQFAFHQGTLEDDQITVVGEEVLLRGYNQCSGEIDSCCGECCNPECCNCRWWTDTLYDQHSSSIAGAAMTEDPPSDPTVCGGGLDDQTCYTQWCMGTLESCGECPRPFKCIDFCIPTRCFSETLHYAEDDEPLMCRGLTQWCQGPVVCA